MTLFIIEMVFLYTIAVVIFVLAVTHKMKIKAVSNSRSWFREKQNKIFDRIDMLSDDIEKINNSIASEPYRSIVHINYVKSTLSSIIIPKLYDIDDQSKEIVELKNTATTYNYDNYSENRKYEDVLLYVVGNNYILYRKYDNISGYQKDIIFKKQEVLSQVFKTLQIISGEDVYYDAQGGELNE